MNLDQLLMRRRFSKPSVIGNCPHEGLPFWISRTNSYFLVVRMHHAIIIAYRTLVNEKMFKTQGAQLNF